MESAELAARTQRWLRRARAADIVIMLKAIHEERAFRILRRKVLAARLLAPRRCVQNVAGVEAIRFAKAGVPGPVRYDDA